MVVLKITIPSPTWMFMHVVAAIRRGWSAHPVGLNNLSLRTMRVQGLVTLSKRTFHKSPCLFYPTKDSFPVIPANYPNEALEYIPDGYSSHELCNLLRSNTLSIPDVCFLKHVLLVGGQHCFCFIEPS